MAKRTVRRRKKDESPDILPAQMSLEDILEEYRTMTADSGNDPESTGKPLRLDEEADGVLTGAVPAAEEPEPEDDGTPSPEEAPAAPENGPAESADPEPEPESAEPEPGPEAAPAPEAEIPAEPGPDAPAPEQPAESAPAEKKTAAVPRELVEGYEEDDFYAGPVDASAPPEEKEEEALPLGDPALPGSREEAEKTRERERRKRRGGDPLRSVWGWIVGLAAAASYRREQARTQPPPDPEDAELEVEPREAARHYAAQMPSLKLRAVMASALTALLAWLSLAVAFGWPLPGSLEDNLRALSLVCLTGEITVMLLGLDIVTSGAMSLFRGRPGAETMIVAASLAALADTAVIALAGGADRGASYAVLPSAAMTFALWGAWFTSRGFYDSFMTYYHLSEPDVVSVEELPDDATGLITSRRDAKGFIRRSEEPSLAETVAAKAFFPMAGVSLALALAVALGSRDTGAFFHLLALFTGLCASFGWLFSLPMLQSMTARRLMLGGAAVSGWTGTKLIGTAKQLVVLDTDVFPADSLEITGVRFLDKENAARIVSCTGSMLSTAGTASAAVFTELMRRYNAVLQTVEDFTVGEGGARGTVNGAEIRVGTTGYMHLSGVKIPDKLREEGALYTAVDGELAGVFSFRYRPMASVQRALQSLRRSGRRPIFALRDFNLDPQRLRREFGVPTEGFRFPSFRERYEISAAALEAKGSAAAVMGREGLEQLTDVWESGRTLYVLGSVCAWASLAGAVLGLVLAVAPCWLGNWGLVSAGRVLVYMLLWVLPALVGSLLLRK